MKSNKEVKEKSLKKIAKTIGSWFKLEIGFAQAHKEIGDVLESTISQTRQEGYQSGVNDQAGQYKEYVEEEKKKARQEVIEENLRSFRRILDEVLISKHSNGIENVEGKDLNGSMFHYFAYKKLKELLEDLNKK